MTDDKFQAIVMQYERLVFTVCYQLVKDYHEAQNLTQETFLSAYQHIGSCRDDEYKPWLARIAANKAKDYLKSAYVRRVQLDFDECGGDMVSLERSPDEIYIAKETEKRVKDQIYSLKEPYLGVAVMFFLEEKNVDQISAALRRPKKTVQTQIYRAKAMLQKMIREELV